MTSFNTPRRPAAGNTWRSSMTEAENNRLTPEQVEAAAAAHLAQLAGSFLELQQYVQPAEKAWLQAALVGATEVRVEVVLSKSGGATIRLLGVDGQGTEERLRVIELAGTAAH